MSAYGLTERERDVTRLILQGSCTAWVARELLVVSAHTVAITVGHPTKTYRLGSVPVRALDDVSIDTLVRFVASSLTAAEQARIGVPWVARAVLTDPGAVAGRCYSLTNWLVEIRTAADEAGLSSDWQRTVDALVVAGDTRLAPYSE
jgi:hypothetical protein